MKTESIKELVQTSAKQEETISMDFTEKELETLSNGVLSLIERTIQAKALVPDTKAHNALDKYHAELQALNLKVCCSA